MITPTAAYTTENNERSKSPVHVVKLNPHPNMLVGAWELDEASGQRADYTGRNELTPVNTPGTSAGKVSATALQLTAASSQYLLRSVLENNCLILNDESFMVTAWVYLDSKVSNRTIASHWTTTSPNQSWRLFYDSGSDRFEFRIEQTSALDSFVRATTFGSPSTATWYFIAGWFDKAADTLYISVNNGTANTSLTASGPTVPMQSSSADFRVGAFDNGGGVAEFWNGRIEQLTLWRRILTSTELGRLYNGGTGAAFTVVTDPSPSVFSTGGNLSAENLGSNLLEPGELIYETLLDKVETGPISTFTFELKDIGSAVSALVATNLIGYKVRFYSGYYDLAFADFVQVFGGRITEITQSAGSRYRFTCRSFLTYAQDKLVYDDASTVLITPINSSDTTWNVQDATAFPNAQSTPQSLRRVVQVDTEISTYRGKAKLANGSWNLTSVVRSAAVGFPFPPYYGAPNSHSANAVVRFLPKLGALTPESNQAADGRMHPVRFMQDTLNNVGNQGLGEFVIPLDLASWQSAETALGRSLQFRYIFGDAVNGKAFLESLCKDTGSFLTERGDGSVGLKLIPLAPSLHAAFKFEESSGDRADVMHTNRSRNYNLTSSGSPGSTTGKIGSAVQLTAASSQYVWRSYGGLQPAATDFSVAVWVYLDSKGGDRVIAGQWDSATTADQCWRLWFSNGNDRFMFSIRDGTAAAVNLFANTLGSPTLATWYLITVTYTRSTNGMTISVNNGAADSTTGLVPVPSTEEFRIGAQANGAGTELYWDGRIDEFGIWFDHVLTAAEITWLYNSGTGRAIEDFPANFPTSSPSSVDSITDSHVLERPIWLRNGERAINHVIYHYDFVPPTNQYTSVFDYKNQSLIDTVGKDIPLEIFSNGIRSRVFETGGGTFCWFDATERFLMNRAEAIIQRFGRESPFIGTRMLYKKNLIESLNDITATFDQVVDLGTGGRSLSSASCEISKLRQDYQSHVIEMELAKYA